MNIRLVQIGKTVDSYLQAGIADYEKRLLHYVKFEKIVLSTKKGRKFPNIDQQKKEEGSLLLSQIKNNSYIVLLDEKGKQYSSTAFADFIQKKQNIVSDLVFLIGGPYGFSDEIYERADHQLSLSKMTLTHQMVRLFFTEQLYRAFTILKGEKYHH